MEFLETKRGQPKLAYLGHKYTHLRDNKDSTKAWRCINRKCSGYLTSCNLEVIRQTPHTCVPDPASVDVEKCILQCKKRVREELTTVPKIFNSSLASIKDAGLEFVTEVPSFTSKKSALYRERRKALGAVQFKSCLDIVLPPKLTSNFLLLDDIVEGDRILVFGSDQAKENVEKTNTFFADGTFKSCCKEFTQLYTIHADIGSTVESTNIVPILYSLLPNKSERTYTRLFSLLKEKLPSWNPTYFKIDFEISAINAFRSVFPRSQLKGCNFHFNQCLWRKVQSLGLAKMYIENTEVKEHIRKCAALAHLPPHSIEDGWISIMETAPQIEAVQNFNDYFVEQWLENSVIGDMWVCFNERHRTTNALEGWHNRLNRCIGKYNPNICELLTVLKDDSKYYDFFSLQVDFNMTPRKRSRKYFYVDACIKSILQKYVDDQISITECLDKLKYVVKLN